MRDGQIFEIQKQEAKRLAMVYRQLQFLDARIAAYETVLSSTWNTLKAIFNRSWLMKQVEIEQLKILREHDQAIRESIEKAKEEKAKPKLTIVGSNGISKLTAICLFLLVSGCVTSKTHREVIRQNDLKVRSLQNEINAKTERLRRFNQINEDGSLRTKRNDDSKGWDRHEGSNDQQ